MCARLTLRCAIVDDERETWTAFILNTEVKEEEDEVEWHGSSLSLLPELEDPPPNQAIPPSISSHVDDDLPPISQHSVAPARTDAAPFTQTSRQDSLTHIHHTQLFIRGFPNQVSSSPSTETLCDVKH
eukprot:1275894-Rhodomonas_salina.5